MKRIVALSILVAASVSATQPDQPAGMWVCRSAYSSAEFWEAVVYTSRAGIQITSEVLRQAAQSKGCRRITSLALRPIEEDDANFSLLIANKEEKVGWVRIPYFMIYMSDPRIRSVRERN